MPSGKRVNRFAEAAANGTLAKPVEVPAEPPIGVQELTLGREMYKKMQCALCHGETGAGDGPQVPTLKDAAGLPIRPRDFNTGLFRGGHTGRDLYLRIHNGLPGTPMVPYGDDVLKPEERWALVHYVQSLRRTDVAVNDLLAPEDSAIRVQTCRKAADRSDGSRSGNRSTRCACRSIRSGPSRTRFMPWRCRRVTRRQTARRPAAVAR